MTDWTKTGAHVAGYAVLAVGTCALAAQHGWPAVAALAVGVVLLLGTLALETLATLRQHVQDGARLAALEKQTAANAAALDKATKDAEAALAASVRLTHGRKQGPEY